MNVSCFPSKDLTFGLVGTDRVCERCVVSGRFWPVPLRLRCWVFTSARSFFHLDPPWTDALTFLAVSCSTCREVNPISGILWCSKTSTFTLSLSLRSLDLGPFTLFRLLWSFHFVPWTLVLSLCSGPFALFLSLRFFHSVPFTLFLHLFRSIWSFHSVPLTLVLSLRFLALWFFHSALIF